MIPYIADDSASTLNFDEAIELSKQKFSFQSVRTSADSMNIQNNRLTVQGTEFDVTQGGIINLCNALKIPDPFAERIPDDLFITNVNRLLKEKGSQLMDLYFNKKEVLIDMNFKTDFEAISNQTLLEAVKSFIPEDIFTRFMFENHRLKIEVATQNNSFDIAKRGEIHNAGYAIQHYPTNKSVSLGNLLLMRTSCTNSAIFPNELFREKLVNKVTKKISEVIKSFLDKLKQFPLTNTVIEDTIEKMHTTEFSIEQAYKQFKKLRRIVGSDDVYDVLGKGFDEESVKMLKEKFEEDPEDSSGIKIYDNFYAITDYGSNQIKSAGLSKRLQIIAGKLFLETAKVVA